jgi:hypothetical protein
MYLVGMNIIIGLASTQIKTIYTREIAAEVFYLIMGEDKGMI